MGEHAWVFWLAAPVLFCMYANRKSNSDYAPRTRSQKRYRADEVERLERELEDSRAEIDALKSRLEAVETIVTDQDLELRREFHKLQSN